MSIDLRITFDKKSKSCEIYDFNTSEVIFNHENSTKNDCFALAEIAFGKPQTVQVCSIDETAKTIAVTKPLITAFLYTEITIVVAVFVVRVLKQLRPI